MWEMVKSSITLFFQGKLFQNPAMVCRQLATGVALAFVIVFGLAFAGLPMWVCAAAGGFFGGLAQPWLFKDLKYR